MSEGKRAELGLAALACLSFLCALLDKRIDCVQLEERNGLPMKTE